MTKKQWKRIIYGIILLMIVVGLWVDRQYLGEIIAFLRNRDAVAAYLNASGIWGPFLYVLILGVQVFSVVIPGHGLMLAAGYLYGFNSGLLLNVIGAMGASQLAFVLSRLAGKPFVQRVLPARLFEQWNNVAERQDVFFFLVCFWFPVIPSNAANYLAGLSSISFGAFLFANVVGRLPGLILVTLIGAYGVELSWQQWVGLAFAGLIVIIGGRVLTARLREKFYMVNQF